MATIGGGCVVSAWNISRRASAKTMAGAPVWPHPNQRAMATQSRPATAGEGRSTMTSKAEGLRDCEDLEAIDHEIARLRAQNAALLEARKPLVAGETLPHQQYEAEYVGYSNILKLGLDQAC